LLLCLLNTLLQAFKLKAKSEILRVFINQIRQQRMLKMIAIADDRHFTYDNEIELLQFIASEMKKEGVDVNNEDNLDSYLNTKIM
jgi:hypothetical protein